MKIKKISEGAEAQIYSGSFFGIEGILKRRIEKKYRIKEIDDNLRFQRTKNEARILAMISELNVNAPRLILLDKYEIYMTKINGILLTDILSTTKKSSMDKIFKIIGEYSAVLHNNNIAHGDYTPANILVNDKKVYIIDFGLSDITNSVEQKALDLLLMKRSVKRELFEIFIENYKNNSKESKLILQRLNEIEKRGRYNTRTLLSK